MPPIKARSLDICELHGKPIDPNSSNMTSLVGTGHGFGGKRSPHYTTGEPRFLWSHAHSSTSCTWTLLPASGSTQTRFGVKLIKLQTLHWPQVFSVHPVTKASSKDEFLGLPSGGVYGHVSVQSRRIWMKKLVFEEALRRDALSGASLRRIVGHLSDDFSDLSGQVWRHADKGSWGDVAPVVMDTVPTVETSFHLRRPDAFERFTPKEWPRRSFRQIHVFKDTRPQNCSISKTVPYVMWSRSVPEQR